MDDYCKCWVPAVPHMRSLHAASPITSPTHYIEGRQYEPRKVAADWQLNFNLGSVLKYISRAGRKPGSPRLEDLKKALDFLQFEIELEEKKK